VNQLLGALALLIVTIYLAKKRVSTVYTLIPMVFMTIMTGWAMLINLGDFYRNSNWLLFTIGVSVFILEVWMILESALFLFRGVDSAVVEDHAE